MIADATVVGLGEATHGSHAFFTIKERVFRHLVEKKGFTTFALELSWSAGLRIDDYLQTGKGDARSIAAQTLANSPWDREEFVHLIEWMRDYNRAHPSRPVHFMGDDIGAPLDDAFFGRVSGYTEKNHPEAPPPAQRGVRGTAAHRRRLRPPGPAARPAAGAGRQGAAGVGTGQQPAGLRLRGLPLGRAERPLDRPDGESS
ncbi:erythromycin esterase family protein [Streptomyces sp. NPDC051578]|uniref:erythromycin esterase family protein n=1 Tax=Streptomyces sp. NPDC051578 TaxID=3365662 RepID=UPI0037BCB3E4